ncbi:MAG: hypothetical protein WAP74_03415 [Patescibacteria group bacterium]
MVCLHCGEQGHSGGVCPSCQSPFELSFAGRIARIFELNDEPTSGVILSRVLNSRHPEDQRLWSEALYMMRQLTQLIDWHSQIPSIIAYSQTLDNDDGYKLREKIGRALHQEKTVEALIQLQKLHDQEPFSPLKDGFGALLDEWSTNRQAMCFCLAGTPLKLFLEFRNQALAIAQTDRGVHLLSPGSTLVFLFYRPCTHPADLMAVLAAMEIMAASIWLRLGFLASQGLQLRAALHHGKMTRKRWTDPQLPSLISATISYAKDAEAGEVTITDTAREAILAATDQSSEPGITRITFQSIMSPPQNGKPTQLIWRP